MPFSIRDELSPLVQQYAMYLRNVRGLSSKTVTEYCKDLRTFFRFVKRDRGLVPPETSFEEIAVQDADLEFIRSVTTYEIYAFMNYVADDRNNMASTRQRKTTTLRSFFGYLTAHEKLLEKDPTETLVAPKKGKSLPHFLSLEQSIELLNAVEGPNAERDRCILTLFLNCGMRLSELVAIDLTDVLRNNNTLRILGKGNKERIVYLNQACQEAISRYLAVRPKDGVVDRNALFLSNRGTRIKPITVEVMVKKYLEKIGLSGPGYSVHKLRHTATTLMYRYGNVDIRVLQGLNLEEHVHLPPGELPLEVGLQLVLQPQASHQPPEIRLIRPALVQQHGQLDILLHTQSGNQIVELVDQPYLPAPEYRRLHRIQSGNVLILHENPPLCGPVHTAHQMEQGGFAGAGSPHYRHKLPFFNGQANTVQRLHLICTSAVHLGHSLAPQYLQALFLLLSAVLIG